MTKIAKDAAAAAAHEENKPENDKDMRSTEASYIARGRPSAYGRSSTRRPSLARWTSANLPDGDAIQTSALVDVAFKGAPDALPDFPCSCRGAE